MPLREVQGLGHRGVQTARGFDGLRRDGQRHQCQTPSSLGVDRFCSLPARSANRRHLDSGHRAPRVNMVQAPVCANHTNTKRFNRDFALLLNGLDQKLARSTLQRAASSEFPSPPPRVSRRREAPHSSAHWG